MVLAGALRLSFKNLARSWLTFLIAAAGLAVGAASFVFFAAAGAGVDRIARDRIFPTLPPNQIEVSPDPLAPGARVGGDAKRFNDASAKRVAALPGVRRTYEKMSADLPIIGYLKDEEAQAFFGRTVGVKMLIPAEGLDPALLARDKGFVGNREKFRHPGAEAWRPIPAIASTQLYETYVEAAESLGVPVFPRERFLGFRFSVIIGQGFGVRARRVQSGEVQPVERTVEIVGFSRYALLVGITFPIDVVREFNRTFAGGPSALEIKSLVVETVTPESLIDVAASTEAMGLKRRTDRYAELVIQVVTALTYLFGALSLVILVVAGLHMGHIFASLTRERATEFATLRALGATRTFISSLVGFEAFWVALSAAGLGIGTGAAASAAVSALVRGAVKPHSLLATVDLFHFAPTTIAVAAGLVIGMCIVGALIPAIRTAFRDPASALTS